ncbi:hypothetical protein MP228_008102 [Amoeboaphelidium protococcarum]|nr:hypothetical protein MP228_008102 [Amoeboaphelidium protococcarum]
MDPKKNVFVKVDVNELKHARCKSFVIFWLKQKTVCMKIGTDMRRASRHLQFNLAVHKQDGDGFKAGRLKTGFRALTRSLKLDVPEAYPNFILTRHKVQLWTLCQVNCKNLNQLVKEIVIRIGVIQDDEVLAIIESLDPDTLQDD